VEKSTLESRLAEWARWKLYSGSHLGYPKSSSFTHLAVDNGRGEKGTYSDVDLFCIETDTAVMSLNDDELFMIRLEYLSNVREMKLKLELCGLKHRKSYYERLNKSHALLLKYFDNKFSKVD
jgi:hypothetical protein